MISRRLLQAALASSVALAAVLGSAPSAAQTAAASPLPPTPIDIDKSRELFAQGRAAADQGDWRRACPLFQAANDLNRTNGTAFSLAVCYDRSGQPDRALPYYQSIVAAGDDKYPERVETSKRRVAEITAAHRAPPVTSPPPPLAQTGATTAPTPAPVPDAPASSRAPAYVAFGIGAAGLAVGGVFTAMAFSSASDAQDGCPDGRCRDESERVATASMQDDARRNGWIGVAAGGIGVAAVVTGIVWMATQGSGTRYSASARGVTVRF